jgi:hypothetical protein
MKVLDDQIRYLNNKDIDGYMTTIASESPARATTESMLRMHAGYTLRYDLEDVKVLNILQHGRAVVRVVQTTRSNGAAPPGSPPFQNNRTTIEQPLVKESSGWKVQNSTLVKIDYIEGPP